MTILVDSQTEVNEKDYWRTPQNLIDDAQKLLSQRRFDTDVCCTSGNISILQAYNYITEQEDALKVKSWFKSGLRLTSFCNPPFSLKWKFFQKGIEQVNEFGKNVLFVLPYTPCSQEWAKYVHNANCVIYVPDGRYNFLLPDGSKPKNSCSFDVCLILLVPFKLGNVIVNYKRGK